MLYYPKIPGSMSISFSRCIAFEKYDGTNLHWAWNRDCGWHAFGTRRDEFNLTDEGIAAFTRKHVHLRESVVIFREKLADGLEQIFKHNPGYLAFQDINAFTEFFGPNSFAGLHKVDDTKQLRLFDVSADNYGFIGPKQFVEDFGHLPIARVIYEGKITGKFTEDVRSGRYDVAEGVICKSGRGGSDVAMAKIKTRAYLCRLKEAFADRWEDHWE